MTRPAAKRHRKTNSNPISQGRSRLTSELQHPSPEPPQSTNILAEQQTPAATEAQKNPCDHAMGTDQQTCKLPPLARTGKPPGMPKKAASILDLASPQPHRRRLQEPQQPRSTEPRRPGSMAKPNPRLPTPRKRRVCTPDTIFEDPLILHRRQGHRRRRGSDGSGAGIKNHPRFAPIYCGEGEGRLEKPLAPTSASTDSTGVTSSAGPLRWRVGSHMLGLDRGCALA